MRVLFWILTCLSLSLTLWGRGGQEPAWFAGNLIAFSGSNNSPGVFSISSFFYLNRYRGVYNADSEFVQGINVHRNEVLLEFILGLIDNLEVALEVYGYQIHNRGIQDFQFGDLNLFFGFQLFEDKKGAFQPAVRFLVGEFFPTGKYDRLDPVFRGLDGVGTGAFTSYIAFIASKTYGEVHPFNWTVNFFYLLSSAPRVRGLNVYAPLPGLEGRVQPGAQCYFDLALQYKFSKHWGCGSDFYLQQENSGSFQSRTPNSPDVQIPSNYSFSLAPSIQYNFSDKASALAGSWFTVAGRNTFAFTNVSFAFNLEF